MDLEDILKFERVRIIQVGAIELGAPLGTGGYGTVFNGKWAEMEASVAVKRMSFTDAKNQDVLEKEARMLNRLKHHNICRLHAIAINEKEKWFYFILELAPYGSLANYLHKRPDLGPIHGDHALSWIKDIACALEYLHHDAHDKIIIHRDLKSDNIVIGEDHCLKLCDFGLSREVDQSTKVTCVGTFRYMAPEIAQGKAASNKSDVYGFALIMREILLRQRPYDGIGNEQAIIWQVNDQGSRPLLPDGLHEAIRNLVRDCWADDPDHRWSMDDVTLFIKTMIEDEQLCDNLTLFIKKNTPFEENDLEFCRDYDHPLCVIPTPSFIENRSREVKHLQTQLMSLQLENSTLKDQIQLYQQLAVTNTDISQGSIKRLEKYKSLYKNLNLQLTNRRSRRGSRATGSDSAFGINGVDLNHDRNTLSPQDTRGSASDTHGSLRHSRAGSSTSLFNTGVMRRFALVKYQTATDANIVHLYNVTNGCLTYEKSLLTPYKCHLPVILYNTDDRILEIIGEWYYKAPNENYWSMDLDSYRTTNKTELGMFDGRTNFSAAYVPSLGTVIAGGYQDGVHLASVKCLSNENTVLPDMHNKKRSFGMEYQDGKLYAVGGYNGRQFLNNIEQLDMSDTDNIWVELKGLERPVSSPQLIWAKPSDDEALESSMESSISSNPSSRLYVVGGATSLSNSKRTLVNFDPQACIQHYCTERECVRSIHHMRGKRKSAACFQEGGEFFIIGGSGSSLVERTSDFKCFVSLTASGLENFNDHLKFAVFNK